MKKIAFAAALLLSSNGLCQTVAAPKEQETLQALLAEVHQLRSSIEAMTVASQRTQIALYALQMQDAAVSRALQRLDEIRNKCKGAEDRKQHMAAELQRIENILSAGTTTAAAAQANELQATASQLKSEVEGAAAEMSTCQATEAEVSSQLRNEQAKLAEAQDRIDRLDKTLEKLSLAGK